MFLKLKNISRTSLAFLSVKTVRSMERITSDPIKESIENGIILLNQFLIILTPRILYLHLIKKAFLIEGKILIFPL